MKNAINAIRLINRNNEEAIKSRVKEVRFASGVTLSGVNSKIVIDGEVVSGEIYAPGDKAYTNSQYNFAESGRKKDSTPPPVDNILPWMAIRGIPEEAKYAVAKYIGKHGIKAVSITQPAIKSVAAINKQIVQKAFSEDIRDKIKEALLK